MKRAFLLLSLLLCFLLAACGNQPAPTPALPNSNTSSGSTQVPANGPTVLHVTRSDPSTTGSLGPLDKTVKDAATVQRLYQSALALPKYATEASISQNCLNDLGVIYHLDFLQGSGEVQRMNLDPGNCKILYFSQTDLRQVDDAFLNLLKQALQVNSLTSN